jgi:stage IV sporulation protein FB
MGRSQFALFGIPVRIDPMFVFGIIILASFAGTGRLALFTGVSLALFTLIHELGHALTARRFGCRNVGISLSFLVGYASYSADTPLSRGRRMLIGLMGPLVQLVTASAVLAVLDNRMRATTSYDSQNVLLDLWGAVLWGGVVLALLNLLPLWPLDGGNLAAGVLEAIRRRDSSRAMARFTLAACGLFVVVAIASRNGTWSWMTTSRLQFDRAQIPQGVGPALLSALKGVPWIVSDAWFILLFCGLGAWRTLAAAGAPGTGSRWIKAAPASAQVVDGRRAADPRAVEAERQGWRTAVPGPFPEPWGPSPWLRAYLRAVHGDPAQARAELQAVATDGPWVAPEATEPQLAALVPLLPQPLPLGGQRSSLWLLEILSQQADGPTIGTYGNAAYGRFHDVEALYLVAAGFTRLGHHDDAMGWLRRAVSEQPEPARIGTGKEFRSLHDRLDFQQLLVTARAAGR